jgi:hypothetical protein
MIFLAAVSSFPMHTLIIADCMNASGKQELDSLVGPLTQVFGGKFADYGIQIADKTGSDTRRYLTSSNRETLLKIKAAGNPAVTTLSFSMEMGDDRKNYAKEIPYNPEESLEQNLTVMLVKILHVFESNILSRVQIASDPSLARMTVDKNIRAITPWESYLAPGNHELVLSLEGYSTLEKIIAVTPGNNRLNYTLIPLGRTDTVVVREMAGSPGRKMPAGLLLLAAGAGALLAGVSQWQYAKADKGYDNLVSNDRNQYDSLHRNASTFLILRNSGIFVSLSGIAIYFYGRAKNAR